MEKTAAEKKKENKQALWGGLTLLTLIVFGGFVCSACLEGAEQARQEREQQGSVAASKPAKEPLPQPELASIVVDRFVIQAEREGHEVVVSLDTDLPDWAEVIVSLSRLYYRVGKEDAYSGTYFDEKARISQWRTPRRIPYDDEEWKADLSANQAEMSQISSDLAYEIDRIDDHLEVRMVLHINQPDSRFGGRGNPHLSGAAVSRSGEWNLIEAERRIPAPLTGPAPPKKSQIVAYDGLQQGQYYQLLKQTPFSPLNSEEMKGLPTDLALRALGSIVQLPAGQMIHVISVHRRRAGSIEYEVDVEGVRGWILSTALMNTGVERAEAP